MSATARAKTHIRAVADVMRKSINPATDPELAVSFASGMLAGLASSVSILDGATAEDALQHMDEGLTAAVNSVIAAEQPVITSKTDEPGSALRDEFEHLLRARIGATWINGGNGRQYPTEHAELARDLAALADREIRGVQAWMANDVHQALGLDVDPRPHVPHQGHTTWADWWANLCGHVRALSDPDGTTPEPPPGDPSHPSTPARCGPECSEQHTYAGRCAQRGAVDLPPAGRCGNDPRTVLSPGDQVAVDEYRAFLSQRKRARDAEATIQRITAVRDEWAGHCIHFQTGWLLSDLSAALDGRPKPEHDSAGHHAPDCSAAVELARLHEGEERYVDETVVQTPAQWIWCWNRATPEERLKGAARILERGDRASRCVERGHEKQIALLQADRAAVARTRAQLEGYATNGSSKVNVRQVLRLLSPVWPDGNYEAPAPAADARQPDREGHVVAYRSNGGRLLRCLQHAPELPDRSFYPVTAEDLEDGGICTHPDCGVDVLTATDKEG